MPRQHHHVRSVERAVPNASRVQPTQAMNPLEVAYLKGQEWKRRGRPLENPYEHHTPNDGQQAAEWRRGYEGR